MKSSDKPARPAICRLAGLPWRDPATGERIPDFCRLEPGQADNPHQALDLSRLDSARHEVSQAALPGLPRGRTFLAEALMRGAIAAEQRGS